MENVPKVARLGRIDGQGWRVKALVFGADRVARVTEVADPVAGSGEVLIEVEAAGLCHTDLDILAGRYPAELPRVPGHEFCGTVVGRGPEATQTALGTRVAVDPLVPCAACRNCRRGHPNLCPDLRAYGSDLDGGIAQYAVVREENCHEIGDLDPRLGAMAEPFACAMHALEVAAPSSDDRALVIGAGPMGIILGVTLRSLGLTGITVADVVEDRLARAQGFGFEHTVVGGPGMVKRAGKRVFDLVIDATGRPEVVSEVVATVADAGTLLVFGVCPPGSAITLDPNEIYARELTVRGSFSLNGTQPAAIHALASSDLPLTDLVTDRYPLDQAVEALDRVGTADTIKIQVDPRGAVRRR